MPPVEIPRLKTIVRHALPTVIESTVAPLALFNAFLMLVGLGPAMFAALAWSWGALGRRAYLGRRLPVPLVLGCLGLTVRTVFALASNSVIVYFLQPTLMTVVVGAAFLLSVPAGKPLAGRMASDFCPLPESVMSRAGVRRVLDRISLLWAFVHMVNAGLTVWLLFSQSISTYLVVKTALGWTLSGCAIALTILWATRELRRHGLAVARA